MRLLKADALRLLQNYIDGHDLCVADAKMIRDYISGAAVANSPVNMLWSLIRSRRGLAENQRCLWILDGYIMASTPSLIIRMRYEGVDPNGSYEVHQGELRRAGKGDYSVHLRRSFTGAVMAKAVAFEDTTRLRRKRSAEGSLMYVTGTGIGADVTAVNRVTKFLKTPDARIVYEKGEESLWYFTSELGQAVVMGVRL